MSRAGDPTIEFQAVSIPRIQRLMARYPRVAKRHFTDAEIAYCVRHARRPAQHFAARFAAKIALRRLLGGGRLREIEVVKGELGFPSPHFSGRAAVLAKGHRARLSLSHEGDLAVALACVVPA